MASVWTIPQERHAELMDDPALPVGEHMHALSALARINLVSLTAWHLAAAVSRLLPEHPGRPVVIVDLACGGGDVTVALAEILGRRLGPGSVKVVGVDASGRAIEHCRRLAIRRRCPAAEFLVADVVAEPCPPCDVAVSTLFLHHLDDRPAVTMLASMAAAAACGGVISDLLRTRAGLALALLGTALLSTSRVARIDGPVSVKAARTLDEYRRLLHVAGVDHATVRRTWPERCLVTWATRPRGPA